jgi:hypothetical protein
MKGEIEVEDARDVAAPARLCEHLPIQLAHPAGDRLAVRRGPAG